MVCGVRSENMTTLKEHVNSDQDEHCVKIQAANDDFLFYCCTSCDETHLVRRLPQSDVTGASQRRQAVLSVCVIALCALIGLSTAGVF